MSLKKLNQYSTYVHTTYAPSHVQKKILEEAEISLLNSPASGQKQANYFNILIHFLNVTDISCTFTILNCETLWYKGRKEEKKAFSDLRLKGF